MNAIEEATTEELVAELMSRCKASLIVLETECKGDPLHDHILPLYAGGAAKALGLAVFAKVRILRSMLRG